MSTTEARQLWHDFAKQRVLVVGDVMLDRYFWGSVTRLSPEAPVPIVAKQRTTALPGGAGNVAVNLAALGADVILVSVAGEGADGAELHSALKERGVSPAHVLLTAGRRTTVKTRIVAHGQQLLRVDDEQIDPLDSELTEALLQRIDTAPPSIGAVILSDYAKGVLTPTLIARVIARARAAGVPVLVDPKGMDYARYSGAYVLTPNRSEAFSAAGLAQDDSATVADAGARLMDRLDIGALLITEGEAGMTLFERGRPSVHFAAAARAVFDVTGAGDTVVAAMGLALSAGGSLQTAAYLANLAGGLAVEQVGTATVTSAMVECILAEHK
ncbi:MAG: D-glycero-beta-D-manno-heptose-7-phosphate kinase [Acidobacteriota bacterium]